MVSWVLHGVDDLRKENLPMIRPAENDVVIKVHACGVCGSDIPRIYETGAHVHPIIPGHEFAGTVLTCGDGVPQGWQHKRVGVFPLIPCGKCPQCRSGQYEMCRNYGYLGSRQDGAFAEYVRVPFNNLIEIPDSVSFETAAMLEPMSVAVHAIRRTELALAEGNVKTMIPKSSDQPWIAVCGLGTIGMFVAMFLWDAGYRKLLLIGNKTTQREMAEMLGISTAYFVNNKEAGAEEYIGEITSGEGTAYFFECVGSADSASLGLRITAPGEQVVLVGNPHGEMLFSRTNYWQILRNQMKVTGTWNSTFNHDASDDWHYVIDRLDKGGLHPEKLISHRYSVHDLLKGLEMMRGKKEPYGKVMMVGE